MPTFTRSVSAASRARLIIASGLGLRDATCPPTHSESMASSSSAAIRRASPPATNPMRISSLLAGRGQWSTSARRARSSGESPRSVVEYIVVVLADERSVP